MRERIAFDHSNGVLAEETFSLPIKPSRIDLSGISIPYGAALPAFFFYPDLKISIGDIDGFSGGGTNSFP